MSPCWCRNIQSQVRKPLTYSIWKEATYCIVLYCGERALSCTQESRVEASIATNFLYPRAPQWFYTSFARCLLLTAPLTLWYPAITEYRRGEVSWHYIYLYLYLYYLEFGHNQIINVSGWISFSFVLCFTYFYTYSFDLLRRASSMSCCWANFNIAFGSHSTVSTFCNPFRRVSLSLLINWTII